MKELHLYTGAEPSNNDLFREIKKKAIRNGIADYAAFSSFVDETVESKNALGFFSDNENLEKTKEDLKLRWSEIQLELEKKKPSRLIS